MSFKKLPSLDVHSGKESAAKVKKLIIYFALFSYPLTIFFKIAAEIEWELGVF